MTPDAGRLLALLPGLAPLVRLSRRELLARVGPWAGAALVTAGCRERVAPVPRETPSPPQTLPASAPPRGQVLGPQAWAIIEAASARILPTDEGAGAREANVVAFIDAQLATPVLQALGPAVKLTAELLDQAARGKAGLGFLALSGIGQDELLTALSRGQLPAAAGFPQKEAFAALHALTLEGFLSDPIYGGNRQMVGWRSVGFAEPGLRPTAPTTLASIPRKAARAAKISARAGVPADTDESFDAIVVGSGAGGGAAAWALCRAGWKVLVLEKGPHIAAENVVHDELGVCRRPYFVPSPLADPNMLAVAGDGAGPGAAAERSTDGWISSCVGGGTVHMAGYFFRMRPEDFLLRSLYGPVAGASVADWPIKFEELQRFYAEAERVIGVSGDAAGEPRRRPAYPLGPLLSHPAGALVDRACARVGLRSFRVARAIVSAPYGPRPACHYCRFCASYGCEVGAKSSTLSTFLAQAADSGNLTLSPDSQVVQVTAAEGRASGVIYTDDRGARHRVRSRVVVLAASAVQTARLLLISQLANGSGQVGKNLMFVSGAGGRGRFALPDPHFPPGARALPFIDRGVQDHYVTGKPAALPHPKAGTLLFQLPHANPIFQSERLAMEAAGPPRFGAALTRRMREFFLDSGTIEFEAFGEWLPNPGCHVTLDPGVKDGQGLPVARITAALHPASRAASDFLSARGRAVLEAAGARSIEDDLPRSPLGRARAYPFLQAGTARMGARASDSVLDPTGQAHEVRNLYVADASGFPSAGGAPHTLTIMANALRVTDQIVKRGRAWEL